MRILIAVLVCLLILLAPAAAEDEKEVEPKKEPPKPRTAHPAAIAVLRAADAVLKAVEATDSAALKALAEKDEPDPWIVADELCYRGEHDAAEAFAKAAPRVDTEALPAYVEAWRKREPDEADRQLLGAMIAAVGAREPQQVIETTAAFSHKLDTVTRIRLRHVRGVALYALRRLKESEDVLRSGAKAARALGWLRRTSRMDDRAGRSANERAAWERALAFWNEKLALDERRGDKSGAANTLADIGTVHLSLGDYAKALSLLQRALAQQQALGDKAGAARTLGSVGNVHCSLADYPTALAIYERALAQLEALGDRVGAARSLGNIGYVHWSLGDYAKALVAYERALERMNALGDKIGAATTLGNIGSVYGALGEHAKALALLQRAVEQFNALGDKAGVATTLGDIGNVYGDLGEYAKARHAYERSARAARGLRGTPLLVAALRGLARLHLGADKPSRALAAAHRALSETESLLGGLGEEQGATARSQYASLYAIGTLAAVREGDAAEALTFLESGRAGALLDSLDKRQALRWKAESLPSELRRLDREVQARERAARKTYDSALAQGSHKEKRAAARALDEASEAVRDIAGRIQRELKQQAGLFYPRAKTIEEIESSLADDQALVLYGLCLDEALALVLRPDSERVVSLGDAADVIAACEALDATSASSDPKAALDTLRKLLVEPLELSKDVKQVLVSPEGPLCYLPFGALFRQTIAMTPSGTTHVLLLGEERAQGQGVLALGAVDYGGTSKGAQAIYYRGRTLSPLPATRKEVETIGTKTLLGVEASEAGLRAALPTAKRWRAVHFACHGVVDIERPMLSSLVLSSTAEDDGFLTALKILRMIIPADLAVLSAAETGKGKIVKGEGIVGLTRAFMFAGAPRVICSLWKVDDEATQALMIKFYELWSVRGAGGVGTSPPAAEPQGGAPRPPGRAERQRGMGAAEALQKAQAYVRDFKDKDGKQKWKHPYYWAAWVLWGLPN